MKDAVNASQVFGYPESSSPLDSHVLAKIKILPKTRYYGSKKRLLIWIYENIKKFNFNTALDAFGGTASVSLLFKAMGKTVTFNDALTSNCISAEALLSEVDVIKDVTGFTSLLDSIVPVSGFIDRNFNGLYYTSQENQWLDGAVQKILSLPTEKVRNIYLYCLFQACLQKRPFNLFHRANLNLRLNSEVSRSFGNLTTWNKPFRDAMLESYLAISRMIWVSGHKHTVLPAGDIFGVEPNYDLVYLDPPYVDLSNKHEDYLKRYHFLEGITNYSNWSGLIDWETKIKGMQQVPHITDWQRKSVARDMLFDLIDKHRKSIVVLSYLADAYPSQMEIIKHFKQSFKKVSFASHKLNHAMAKKKKNELLIIGE